jgi:hypothetical protein
MFVRWKSRIRECYYSGSLCPGDVTWTAILAGTKRVNGQPRQQHIAYLGSISEGENKMLIRRCQFWDRVADRLDNLGNRITNREQIEIAIARKVPRPSADEYKEAARNNAVAIGWEWITDRQKAALKDEAEQLQDCTGALADSSLLSDRRSSAATAT